MSPERQRRLRRTLVIATVVFVLAVWAITRAFGSDQPATPSSHPSAPAGAVSAATPPDASASSGPSASASAPAAGDPSAVPTQGDGKLTMVAIPGIDTTRVGKAITFGVDVEGGLGVNSGRFAAQVRAILSDGRGWEVADGVHFVALSPAERVAGRTPDILVTLASPALTDQLCAPLQTLGKVSCNRHGRAVINALRWTSGVEFYTDLGQYRTYLINHEVGHGLWHPHENCRGAGQKAPIMQQQSLGLEGCLAWPYPTTG